MRDVNPKKCLGFELCLKSQSAEAADSWGAQESLAAAVQVMELTYTIVGGDGGQYGPVNTEQLRRWIQDGRVAAHTQVWRSDTPSWVTASALPELGLNPTSAAAGASTDSVSEPDPALAKRVKMGVSWFYWIAALSLFNSVSALCNWDFGFYLGLGITQWIDGFANALGPVGGIIALVIGLFAAGILVLLGIFSAKGHAWAFIVGLILLGLDTLIVGVSALVVPSIWIGVGLHVWALISIFTAFKASREMR